MFMFIMSGALDSYGITKHIAHFFLTRKITNGRPWLFIFIIGLACILLGAFSSPFTSILVFWPIMDDVFQQLGYEDYDDLPVLVRILVVASSLLGFPIAPFMQNGLVLIQNFAIITSDLPEGPVVIPDGGYLLFTSAIALIMWAALILFSKYFLRPDTSKLEKLDIELFINNKPAPMDTRQKGISLGFLAIIALMLIPSIFPNLPGMEALRSWNAGIPLAVTAVLCMILLKDGKPILNFPEIASTKFMWDSFFIVASAMYLGDILTDETTGISAFLNWILDPLLSGMSPFIFTIFIVLLAGVLSNLGNSLVIGLILQQIVLSFYITNPVIDVYTINTLLIYFVLGSALILPSASPFAAMMHGNSKISPKMIYKVTPAYVLIEFAVIVIVGIPLCTQIMNLLV
jgi:sodium-dependent dicarboxylate transporter 2/3/5